MVYLTEEGLSDIWTWPIFTEEFCEMVIEEAEHQLNGLDCR
jgi:hypothetical protein